MTQPLQKMSHLQYLSQMRESGGMADALDLGSSAARRGGSSPPSRTIQFFGGRPAARFHSFDDFAEPAAISLRAIGARSEADCASYTRPKQRVTEHENKKMRRGEERLF